MTQVVLVIKTLFLPWEYNMRVCIIVVPWVFIKCGSLLNEHISEITHQIIWRLEIYRENYVSKGQIDSISKLLG